MTDRIPLDAGTTRPAMGGEIASDELVAEVRKICAHEKSLGINNIWTSVP